MNRSEKVLTFIKENLDTPYTIQELASFLQVPNEDLPKLEELLKQLLSEQKLKLTKRKRYVYQKEEEVYSGAFIGNEKGFGFVRSESFTSDIFIPKEDTLTALNGDTVEFKVVSEAKEGRRAQGAITRVTERSSQILIGTFQKSRSFGFVVADDKKFDKDIFIAKKNTANAQNGQKVVVKITDYLGRGNNPEGVITEVLGYFGEDGNDIKAVIKRYGLEEEFPQKVMAEATKANQEVAEKDIKNRVDLRDRLIVTIDGADAKDLDDAISLTKLSEGEWELGVHIADVSHYVKEGSALDQEAYGRGTSVYLVDRVIPMLPRELSNGICSLHPDVDRLTLSVFMVIDKKGVVQSFEIKPSVIRSKHRLTYSYVTDVLEGRENCEKELGTLLFEMEKLALILRKKRQKRGSLDFNFPECKVILDEKNEPIEIKKYELGISNYIIEEFMLAANETVAEYVFWQGKPFIYRVHEEPDPDKIDHFSILVKNLGFQLKKSKEGLHPKALLELLEQCKGHQSEKVIQTVMLRSLMKARYLAENRGHFGLATQYYCHFTSPIRRYPDLVVHRVLKLIANNGFSEKNLERYTSFVEKAAEHSSLREQLADSAERETEDIKKAEYMAKHIGEEFEGIISSVTAFGIFVELPNTIEGLIRFADLNDDYYEYNEKTYEAIGERTKKRFTIGDLVRVQVAAASPQLQQIDFELLGHVDSKE